MHRGIWPRIPSSKTTPTPFPESYVARCAYTYTWYTHGDIAHSHARQQITQYFLLTCIDVMTVVQLSNHLSCPAAIRHICLYLSLPPVQSHLVGIRPLSSGVCVRATRGRTLVVAVANTQWKGYCLREPIHYRTGHLRTADTHHMPGLD